MDTLAMWNNPTAIIIVLVILLLLFGGQKIPEMMRGLGSGMKEFKKSMNEEDDEQLRRDRAEEEMRREVRARIELEEREKRDALARIEREEREKRETLKQ